MLSLLVNAMREEGWPEPFQSGDNIVLWGDRPRGVGAYAQDSGFTVTQWGDDGALWILPTALCATVEEAKAALVHSQGSLPVGSIVFRPSDGGDRRLLFDYPITGGIPYVPGDQKVYTPLFAELCRLAGFDPDSLNVILDQEGRMPAPPAPAFQQVVHGQRVAVFTSHEFLARILKH